ELGIALVIRRLPRTARLIHREDVAGDVRELVELERVDTSAVPNVLVPPTAGVAARGTERAVVPEIGFPEVGAARIGNRRRRRGRHLTHTGELVALDDVVAGTREDAEHHVHPPVVPERRDTRR